MPSPTRKNLLVTLSDEKYLDYAKQLFSSVYWNAGWEGDYMLLAHDVPEHKLAWFRDKGILVYRCEPVVERKIGRKHHPAAVFGKFHLFKEYFKQWNKVIFLDADIIVKASLDRLLETRGFAAPKAMSLSLRKEFHAADRAAFEELKRTYPFGGPSFCTGVFVFDTAIIKPDTFQRLAGLTERFGRLSVYGEEGVLNLLFYRAWSTLPVAYNVYPIHMGWIYGIKPANVRGIVLHFLSPKRPWHPENPFYGEWMDNFKKAEAIDLSNRKKAAHVWSEREIKEYGHYVRRRGIMHYPQHLFWLALHAADYYVGRTGLFLKKNSPAVYWRMRDVFILPIFVRYSRGRLGIQMGPAALSEIMRSMRPPLNMLVFGVGADSGFWIDANKGGRTVFLEDDPVWLEKIRLARSDLEAYKVSYGSLRGEWRDLIDRPEKLAMELPAAVIGTPWDIVIVDGPAGYNDGTPGRMKSIFMASRLAGPGAHVFVHDAEREVERAYCGNYLGRGTLIVETKERPALRHYLMPAASSPVSSQQKR